MDLAWAYSLNTIQLCGNTIYGTTVLGGNIMKVDMDGKAIIVWENDYADQSKGSVFLHSIEQGGILYFFPYMSEFIIAYDYHRDLVTKIKFEDKEDDEIIYAHVYGDMIFMFGLSTGRVWMLEEKIKKINMGNNDITPLSKLRNGNEEGMVFFWNPTKSQFSVYNCNNNIWINAETKAIVKNGIAEDGYIWYGADGCFRRYTISSGEDVEVLRLADFDDGLSVIKVKENSLLIISQSVNAQYLIDMQSQLVERVNIPLFTDNYMHFAKGINEDTIFVANIESLDWMICSGDEYALCSIEDMSIQTVPIFDMEDGIAQEIKKRHAKIAWDLAPNGAIFESKKEGLEFFIESLEIDIFAKD